MYTNYRHKHNNYKMHKKPSNATKKTSFLHPEDFPSLTNKEQTNSISNSRKEEKESTIQYLSVAKEEIKLEKQEIIPDGWVKIVRDDNGIVVRKYGKEIQNTYIDSLKIKDMQHLLKDMERRHEYYKTKDESVFYSNYKYSWESESDDTIESESDDSDQESEKGDEMDDCDY